MSLLDDVSMLINEFVAKHGKYPTTVYVGSGHINELNRLEKLYGSNNSFSRYRMRKVVLGKKIKPPTLFGLKYHRSCANTCVY